MLEVAAREFLLANHVHPNIVELRLKKAQHWQQQQPSKKALQLQQVRAVHKLLQHQQHLGRISSAAAVIEALPETLLHPPDALDQLRALLAELRSCGFSRQHLTALLTNCGSAACHRADARALLDLPAELVAPRLASLGSLLGLSTEQVPPFVAASPQLLTVLPEAAAASLAWMRGVLGWSRASARRAIARQPQLLMHSAADLDAAAFLLQRRMDLTTAELVLMLHIAPGLLSMGSAELEALAAVHPTALELARAAAVPPEHWNVYAAQALHQRLCVLKLASVHGLTLEEVGAIARDKPTVLHEQRV